MGKNDLLSFAPLLRNHLNKSIKILSVPRPVYLSQLLLFRSSPRWFAATQVHLMSASSVERCRCSFCDGLLCNAPSSSPAALHWANCWLIVRPCCDDPQCLCCRSVKLLSEPAARFISIFGRLFPHIQLPCTNIPFVAERGRGGGRGLSVSPFLFFILLTPLVPHGFSDKILSLITAKMFPLHPFFLSLLSPSWRCFSGPLLTPQLLLAQDSCGPWGDPHTPHFVLLSVFPAWQALRTCFKCSPAQTQSSAEGPACRLVSPRAARPLCCENSTGSFPQPQVHQETCLVQLFVFVCPARVTQR